MYLFCALSVYSGRILFIEVLHMNGLWSDILETLSFIVGCLAIIVGLALLAKLAEHFMPGMRKVSKARYVSIVGICAAIATGLHMLV